MPHETEVKAIRNMFAADFDTKAKEIASEHGISVVDTSLIPGTSMFSYPSIPNHPSSP
jgi:hypothetical protein